MEVKKRPTGIDRIRRINELMRESADPRYSIQNMSKKFELGVDHIITEMFVVNKKYKDGVEIVGHIMEDLRIDRLLLPEELVKLLRKGNIFLLTVGRVKTGEWKLLCGSNIYL